MWEIISLRRERPPLDLTLGGRAEFSSFNAEGTINCADCVRPSKPSLLAPDRNSDAELDRANDVVIEAEIDGLRKEELPLEVGRQIEYLKRTKLFYRNRNKSDNSPHKSRKLSPEADTKYLRTNSECVFKRDRSDGQHTVHKAKTSSL